VVRVSYRVCHQSVLCRGAWLQSLHTLLVPETYGLRRGTPEFERVAVELLQEAQLLHSLRHENIVQLRGVTMHPEHGHVQWLVTEYADGGSLEAWVRARGRMTLE
jgi:serine/threonine protein kinase